MLKALSAVLVILFAVSVGACRKPPADAQKTVATSGQTGTQPVAQTQPEPPKPVPAQLPDVLARVNGEAITKVEFDRLIKNMEMQAGRTVPAERRDEILRGALDQLVTRTLLAQETKTRNITVTDAELDDLVKQVRTQFPDEKAFEKALADRGVTVQRLRDDARIDMSIQKMMDAEIASLPAATDAQVREFYDKNPDKFQQPESVRASHILIRADQNADDATKKKARAEAEAILTKAKGGADFAALAKQHSADGSSEQGGDLGFFPKGQMVPAFDQAVFALKDGEISDIVTTQFGFHIIKRAESKAASTVPFEQVNVRIREFLTEQNKENKAEAFVDGLKKKARIEVLI